MPATYEFDGPLLHLKLAGEYTTDELRNTLEAALADVDCPSKAQFFMDLRKSSALSKRSSSEIQAMAKFLAGRAARFDGRLAMAVSTELHYGLMRMAEVFSESSGLSARVFATAEEALAWLRREA